ESTSPTPLCSAVSIDSAFALTSAKCLDGFLNDPQSLVYSTKPNIKNYKRFVKVSNIWTPNYEDLTADLAIVKLDVADKGLLPQNSVCYLDAVKPIKKQSGSSTSYKEVHILRDAGNDGADRNLEINLNIISTAECSLRFGPENIPRHIFCAEILDDSVPAPVASGTGLYARHKNSMSGEMQVYLKGIAIQPEFPVSSAEYVKKHQLFINTRYFLNWVTEVLEKNF
ncbi:unnamed protein product, partial [Allacma fusca]